LHALGALPADTFTCRLNPRDEAGISSIDVVSLAAILTSMRGLIIGILLWTMISAGIVLVWPGSVQTPGCLHAINPSADCLAQAGVESDRVWWTQTLPVLVIIAAGYVGVASIALLSVHRRRG
jgi:hypothetical protein